MIDFELKAAMDALQGENKTIFADLKNRFDELKTANVTLQTQLDAIDAQVQQRHIAGVETKSLVDLITEHPRFVERKANGFAGRERLSMSFRGQDFLERKTNITDGTLGFATSGTLLPMRLPGVSSLGAAIAAHPRFDGHYPFGSNAGRVIRFRQAEYVRSNATSPQVEAPRRRNQLTCGTPAGFSSAPSLTSPTCRAKPFRMCPGCGTKSTPN